MNVKRVLTSFLVVMFFSIYMSSTVKASEIIVTKEVMDEFKNNCSVMNIEENHYENCEHVHNNTRSYCDHSDPTLWYNPHSSMRYVRTVYYSNNDALRYDQRDYYVCVFCGYETFWVHGFIPYD